MSKDFVDFEPTTVTDSRYTDHNLQSLSGTVSCVGFLLLNPRVRSSADFFISANSIQHRMLEEDTIAIYSEVM